MTVFDTAADTLFADDNMAVDAVYTPNGGAPIPGIRAILTHGVDLVSIGFSDVSDRRTFIALRNSEVTAPGRGDTVVVGVTTYTVDVVIEDDGIITEVAVK